MNRPQEPQASASPLFSPGTVLLNRYELRRSISRGGMGEVEEAFDNVTQKLVALKVLLPHHLSDPGVIRRFLTEWQVTSKLKHPGIVEAKELHLTGNGPNGSYFIAMELLQGKTFRAVFEAYRGENKQIPVSEMTDWLKQICHALVYAHQTTIHRDIKPENLFLTQGGQVKVMDFGLAALNGNPQPKPQTGTLGTPYYMPPEQFEAGSEVDARADQYALALTVYEGLSGFIPVGTPKPLHALRADIPNQLSDAVSRALNADPENRFRSIADFWLEISGEQIGLPVIQVATHPPQARLGRWLIVIFAILILTIYAMTK